MSKPTPGPWTAIPDSGEDSEGNWYVHADNEDCMSLGLPEADARLIAAAPDLLAALKNLLERSGHLSVFGSDPSVKAVRQAGDYIKAVDDARAAIAKAEGTL